MKLLRKLSLGLLIINSMALLLKLRRIQNPIAIG